ncbi:hypothetical protein JN535_08555 [Cellulosimicrobium cellulans]|uniref:hypothetical protein n=1 Tax=Cellulosimicrobium cellulans TaxID=1710 RepID=UPI001966462A|nr:hypothetical protein [Cellulosimicrobium cellulans]MBN0040216.1 hypothetical protein [Cellulosimicrobium cellulans]
MSRAKIDRYWAYLRRVRARRLRIVGTGLALAAVAGVIAATDTPAWINQATPTNTRHLKEHLR